MNTSLDTLATGGLELTARQLDDIDGGLYFPVPFPPFPFPFPFPDPFPFPYLIAPGMHDVR